MYRFALLSLLLLPAVARTDDKTPEWVEPMRKVHARFTGTKGTCALFGDSITVSLAFWAGLPGSRKGMDDGTKSDFELVNTHMKKADRHGVGGGVIRRR